MADASGSVMVKQQPWPKALANVIVPPTRSMLDRTTSIPTPRPETIVTVSAVEKPGRKMNAPTC